MNIGITATGGGVGQSIIKALKGSDYNLIAMDSSMLGTGLFMVDNSQIIPEAHEDDYIPELLSVCEEEKIDLLFPGMDCELSKLSANEHLFAAIGTQIVISSPDVINIADDKTLTNQFLKTNGFPALRVYDPSSIEFPCICKPNVGGARSRNIVYAQDWQDIPSGFEDYVIQEIIEGDEYTCGTVTLGDYVGCIVMRRYLRDGDTYKAFVERNSKIEELCEIICRTIKPFGAFNIQLRLRDGIPYVFEFNARCSGTTAARALAGFNEPLMIADYLLKGKKPSFDIKPLTILRYWNELVV